MVEEFNKLIDANTSVSKLRTLGFLSVKGMVLPTSSSSVGMLKGSQLQAVGRGKRGDNLHTLKTM